MKLSIIIPVYNGEKYIDTCLSCLKKTNRFNYEIILINDGSIDKTDSICRKYASENENILYFSKENGGVSSARNYGISKSNGEFITFIDVDDTIDFDKFALVFEKTLASNLDFLILDLQKTYKKEFLLEGEKYLDVLSELIVSEGINSCCVNTYKKELIEKYNIRFDQNLDIGEDAIFNINYYSVCKKIYVSNVDLYFYIKSNPNSLTQKYRENKIKVLSEYNEMLRKLLLEKFGSNKKLRLAADWKKIKNYFSCLSSLVNARKILDANKIESQINLLRSNKKRIIIFAFGMRVCFYSFIYSILPTKFIYNILVIRRSL